MVTLVGFEVYKNVSVGQHYLPDTFETYCKARDG